MLPLQLNNCNNTSLLDYSRGSSTTVRCDGAATARAMANRARARLEHAALPLRSPYVSMSSPCCVTGSTWSGTPTGSEQVVGGIPTYVARPPGEQTTTKVLILLTDVFGWRFNNARLLADRFAAQAGLVVLVPDLHSGDSMPSDFLDCMIKPARSWTHRLRKGVVAASRLPGVIWWVVSKHGDKVTLPLVSTVMAAARSELKATRVATIGFCWGGRFSVLLGAGVPCAGADVVMAAHPSGVTPKECANITVPSLFLLASSDALNDPAAIEKAMAARPADKTAPSVVKVYAGTTHSFAARGNEGEESEKVAMDASLADAVSFLKQHL